MAALLSGGLGALLRAFGGLRCSSSISSSPFSTTMRWFTNDTGSDNRPKRPLTAYVRYVQEQQPIFKKQYPDVRYLDLTKYIALAWKSLPDSEKRPYEEAAEKCRQVYKEELNLYKLQLSGAQIGAMQEAKRQRKAKRKKIRRKRELTVLGKPKRPRSAFNVFMAEHFQDATGEFVTTKMKSLYDDWRQLPSSQKQPYIQLAEDDRIRYENEMKSWEEQMIEVGREDLIRSKNRRKLRKPRTPRTQKKTVKSVSKIKNAPAKKASSSVTPPSPKTEKPSRTNTAEE